MQAIKNPLQERALGKVFMLKTSLAIQKTERKLCVQGLTACSLSEHTLAVGRNYQHIAKFWGYYPLTGRQHRHHLAGGFFTSVECAHRFMPGVRRLQNDENRNKRVVSLVSHSSARQLCPTTKTQQGAVVMTAIHSMGNSARKLLLCLPFVRPVSVGGAA